MTVLYCQANSPTVVRDFVLLLIQKWAHDYENVHELVTICAMYETLKQKGECRVLLGVL